MNIEFDTWFKEEYHSHLALSNRFETMYIALELFIEKKGRTIVETGVIRKDNQWMDGLSTLVLGSFCERYNHRLFAVDISADHIEICKKATAKYGKFITYVVGNSIDFLKEFNQTIDLLYLDSMDCPEYDAESSPALLASQHHQLSELQSAFDKLSHDPIVLLDDNDFENGGKTKLAKSYLIEMGFAEIMSWKQSLWVKG